MADSTVKDFSGFSQADLSTEKMTESDEKRSSPTETTGSEQMGPGPISSTPRAPAKWLLRARALAVYLSARARAAKWLLRARARSKVAFTRARAQQSGFYARAQQSGFYARAVLYITCTRARSKNRKKRNSWLIRSPLVRSIWFFFYSWLLAGY